MSSTNELDLAGLALTVCQPLTERFRTRFLGDERFLWMSRPVIRFRALEITVTPVPIDRVKIAVRLSYPRSTYSPHVIVSEVFDGVVLRAQIGSGTTMPEVAGFFRNVETSSAYAPGSDTHAAAGRSP
jgi:hypothetical protein